jgi:hypothetical protein
MPRPVMLSMLLAVTSLPAGAADSPAPPVSHGDWDDATKERFLLQGSVRHVRDAAGGSTPSKRATLSLDGIKHDAHIQAIDVAKPMADLEGGPELDFRDSYRNNIAAYRLDRLLGLGMVPVTVLRAFDARPAAFTWWLDDVRMSEGERLKKKVLPPNIGRWNERIFAVRIFDELIYNTDRNLGNLLIDGDWRLWMIDHSRAFKIFKTVRREEQLGKRCPRQLLAALRGLDEAALQRAMEDLLIAGQIEGLLGRRDQIVAHFDAEVAKRGEAAVLYDLPPPTGPEPASH